MMAVEESAAATPLLAPDETPPYVIENADGAAPVVLLCDHASNRIPRALDGLGLAAAELERHISWDIGAAEVTRLLASRLDAPAVLAGYSRLAIDLNRRLDHPTSIVTDSDGTAVPGNLNLSADDVQRRIDAIFHPYHRAVEETLAGIRQRGMAPAVLAIHSFTPEMDGIARPWQVSVLWNSDQRIPRPLIAALRAHDGLTVGDNQPYSGREHYGYSIETHASAAGLPNALIEIREDQVRDEAGIGRCAGIIGGALEAVFADANLFRVEHFE